MTCTMYTQAQMPGFDQRSSVYHKGLDILFVNDGLTYVNEEEFKLILAKTFYIYYHGAIRFKDEGVREFAPFVGTSGVLRKEFAFPVDDRRRDFVHVYVSQADVHCKALSHTLQ